jgi:hypothetical protein
MVPCHPEPGPAELSTLIQHKLRKDIKGDEIAAPFGLRPQWLAMTAGFLLFTLLLFPSLNGVRDKT